VAAAAVLSAVALAAWPRPEKVRGHAYAIPSGADRVVVEVLNASGRDGLARRVTRELRSRGLDVVSFGNQPGIDSTLVLLRRALGQGIVRTELDTLRRVDVTVVLGTDFRMEAELRP
jgi:hypothetical protein